MQIKPTSQLENSRLLFEFNPLLAQHSTTDAEQFAKMITNAKSSVEAYYKHGYPTQY